MKVVMVTGPSEDDRSLARVKEPLIWVECPHTVQHMLWEHWHGMDKSKARVTWVEDLSGYMYQTGSLMAQNAHGEWEEFPVTISIFFATVAGVMMAFWESPSRVTDSEQTEAWIRKWANPAAKVNYDYHNFHIAVHAAQDIVKQREVDATLDFEYGYNYPAGRYTGYAYKDGRPGQFDACKWRSGSYA